MALLNPLSPDRDLIREYLRGNPEAFRLLLQRHQPSVLHYALGFLPADEEVRATVRRALRRGFSLLSRLRRNSLFSSFLIGILRHELKRKGRKKAPDDVSPLWSGLAGLPRVQREVVFLFFQGLSIPDVARARHEPPSQTRSRFTNALHHVAKKVSGQPAPGKPAVECAGQDELYLYAAGALPPERVAALQEHSSHCADCGRRNDAAAALFEALRRDIRPLTDEPLLLTQIPGPSVLSTIMASAGIILAAFICFVLLRAALADRVVQVRELPSGKVQVLEPRPGASAPADSVRQ